MKRTLFQLALVVSLGIAFLYPATVEASHFAGAELTYEWLGGSTYELRLVIYRDCSGSSVVSSYPVNYSSCSGSGTFQLNQLVGNPTQIVPYCPGVGTSCGNPFGLAIGIQKYVYRATVNLQNCPDWVFSWTGTARNSATNTVSQGNMYIEATLDNTNGENSSPQFNTDPVALMCAGQGFTFSQGATDADGDQLTYTLVSPMQSAIVPVNYASGFSAGNPISSSPALSLNSTNGTISTQPTQLQTSVMAVQVTETRNGDVIGSIVRDMYLIVIDCANNPPFTTGINGSNTFVIDATINAPISFSIPSGDPDADNLSMSWDQGIPGALFSTSGGAFPVGSFSWTPTISDAGQDHVFQVTVADDGCPLSLSNVYTFIVRVCVLCIPEVYYENRGNSGVYGNLPAKTISQTFIEAGTSVTPALIDGPVRVESNEEVEFIATERVLLRPGFVALGSFLARIAPSDCPAACQMPDLTLAFDIDTSCTTYTVMPVAVGGIGPYTYTTGNNNQPLTTPLLVSPASPQTIIFSVQDGVGGVASVPVTFTPLTAFQGAQVAVFPNAFTPNGDGINDIWFVGGVGGNPPLPYNAHTYSLQIFNQWGNLIYQISRTDFGGLQPNEIQWDGIANVPPFAGQGPIEGAYVYVCEITNCSGTFQRSGTITLFFLRPQKGPETASFLQGPVTDGNTSGLRIYPNPVRSAARLEFSLPEKGNVKLQLQDSRGKIVRWIEPGQVLDAGAHQFNLDTDALPAGIYFCTLTHGTRTETIRLAIQ